MIVWSLGLFRGRGRAKTARAADAPRTAETSEDDDAEFVQTGADFSFGDAEETSPIGAGLLQRKVEMQMETEAQLSFTRPCAPIVVAASQRDAAHRVLCSLSSPAAAFEVEEELIVPYSSPNAATPGVASSSSLVESDSGVDILRTNIESGARSESFFASDEDGVSDDDGVIVIVEHELEHERHLQEHMVPLAEIIAVQNALETRVSLHSVQVASL